MEILKSCPFCGGEATPLYCENGNRYTSNILYPSKRGTIKCKRCEVVLPRSYSRVSKAIEAWNRRQTNWISVNERLPKDDQRVLICYKHPCNKSVKMLNLAFFQEIGKYDFVDGKRNVFCYDSDEWGHRPYEHVTHWMPLPEPPKEEE